MEIMLSLGVLILGLFVGFLVNYLADILPYTFAMNTLPEHRQFRKPDCQHCQFTFSWRNYILMQACKGCGRKRSLRSWIVLFSYPLIFIYLWLYPPARLGFGIAIGLLIYLGLVTVIDIEHRAILLITIYAGGIFALIVGWHLHGIAPTLIGGGAGFGIMLGLYGLGILFSKWMAKIRGEELDEVALGYGDVLLCGVLGLLLGWPGITAGLVISILIAGLVSAGYILVARLRQKYRAFTPIPYGPFLILGAILLLFRV